MTKKIEAVTEQSEQLSEFFLPKEKDYLYNELSLKLFFF